MENVMFTPADITAFCNLILVIAGVGALIWNGWKKAKEPDVIQNKKISAMEGRLNDHDRLFEKMRVHLDNDKHRLDEIESASRITNRVIIQTLQVLVRHGIDGNNKDELIEADKELNRYLLNERWGHEKAEAEKEKK